MKKVLILVLAVFAVFMVIGLEGCKKTGTSTGETPLRVVYSIPGLSAPIWTAASEGFKAQAATYGWDAEILDPNDSLETQISQIENALTRGVDAVIITPIDGEAVSTLMGQCAQANIPVVAIDRQVKGTALATVEADNLLVGRQLGEMYLETLGDAQGKVLIVGGPLSSSATVNRTEGFKAAIQEHSNVTIVAESATEMDSEIVLAAVTNYLQANPDINCIMSCTDYILPAVMTALEENGKIFLVGERGHVNIYSVDGDGYGLGQVVAGRIDATYGLDPYAWAASAVEAIKTSFDGGAVSSSILIAGNIVTAANFEELKNKGALWGAGSM
jgi:ABC-type sugar transport system substrate-binding protein